MAERVPKRRAEERITFEEAFNCLEEAVQALEVGGLTLAEATRLYEEGMRLARICNELLSATELRITRLQTSFGEQMRFLSEEESSDGSLGTITPAADGAAQESPTEDSND